MDPLMGTIRPYRNMHRPSWRQCYDAAVLIFRTSLKRGKTHMKAILRGLGWGAVGLAAAVVAVAQAPGGAGQRGAAPAGGRGPARVALSVTSNAFADGGEVPMRHAGRGENKS